MDITFTIPDDKLPRIIAAFKGLFPIPTTTNEETGETTPVFADGAWAKECIKNYIIQTVKRYEQMAAQQQIATTIKEDKDLVT